MAAPSPERVSSVYAALGVTMSGRKWCSKSGRPHLGFNGRGEAAARSLDWELFDFKPGTGGGLLWWTSVQGKRWGSTMRLQRFSLSGQRCLTGFETVWRRWGARCGGGHWGKSFARAPGRSFYRAKSPTTSGTMSRIYSPSELKIDPQFD
jgi:hypothetical protein